MKALIEETLPDMERALQESRDSWQRHIGGVEMLRLLLTEAKLREEENAHDVTQEGQVSEDHQ